MIWPHIYFRCSWRMIYLIKKRKMLRKPMATPFDREILKKLKDYSVLTRSGRTIRSLSDDSSIAGGNTERIYCKSRYMEINFFREINFTEIVKLISRKKNKYTCSIYKITISKSLHHILSYIFIVIKIFQLYSIKNSY